MSNIILSNNFPTAQKDIATRYINLAEQRSNPFWKEYGFQELASYDAYETDVINDEAGLVPRKDPGSGVSYSSLSEQGRKTYVHNSYSLGLSIANEAKEDGHYGKVFMQVLSALVRAPKLNQEVLAANVINTAFTALAYDGQTIINTAHPVKQNTVSNGLATSVSFSEAAVEQLYINILNAKRVDGFPGHILPQKLLVPTSLATQAQRLVESSRRVDTANNDINVLNGMFPQGVTASPYLDMFSTKNFFIVTDAENGLTYYNRKSPEISEEGDFNREATNIKVFMRCSFGITNYLQLFGAQGL